MFTLLALENMPPFPRINRFTGLSWYWRVNWDTPTYLYEMAVFRWDLGLSRFKPSEVVFAKSYILLKEHVEMAKQNGTPTATPANPFKGFINVDLTDDDKSFVEANWAKSKMDKMLPDLVDVGKVSFSYNERNNTYNCAIVFYAGSLCQHCVSSFAPNPLMALFITWLKIDRYGEVLSPESGNINKPLFG